jgi:DNA-binding transcriptional LysR family regulator
MITELRHFRYFVVMAEELHFGRAAARLHIEQSPLSRAIRELEDDLGVRLLHRTTRRSCLTRAGVAFLKEARHVLAAVEQARVSVTSAALGFNGYLRIAVSDALAQPRMAEVFARCREEEPEVELRIFEMPVAQLIKALRQDEVDIGFTLFYEAGDGYVIKPLWHDAIVVAMPARHPLLSNKQVALADALQYPLVMCHPEMCQGGYQYVDDMLRKINIRPMIAEHMSTLESMLTMVGAGYGISFVIDSQISHFQRPDVAVRPMGGNLPPVTTYLIQADVPPSEPLARFIDRARLVGGLTPPDAPADAADPAAPRA